MVLHVMVCQKNEKARLFSIAENVIAAMGCVISLMATEANQVDGATIEVRNMSRNQTVVSFTFYRGDWG